MLFSSVHSPEILHEHVYHELHIHIIHGDMYHSIGVGDLLCFSLELYTAQPRDPVLRCHPVGERPWARPRGVQELLRVAEHHGGAGELDLSVAGRSKGWNPFESV